MVTDSHHLITEIESELQKAEIASIGGNKGKARVCARRAAGWAIREWQSQNGVFEPHRSAYWYLQVAAVDYSLPTHVRTAAGHLIMRITEDHNLPVDADVLADARVLVDFFLDSNHGS